MCACCDKDQDRSVLEEKISNGEVMKCESCDGPVKPKIVFFGENLPEEFFKAMNQVQKNCDLLIVMGTALAVGPFNQIVDLVGKDVPKVLINM